MWSLPFTLEELDEAVKTGQVRVARHPEAPFSIYNYTPQTVYQRLWSPVTTTCRGLVLDPDANIVARPFQKFWNYGEVVLPSFASTMPPLVTSKVDGSLGLIYPLNGDLRVATRGSFTSTQALRATEMLKEKYGKPKIPEGITPLVEIVGRFNQIVVPYEEDDLILLGAINNETGADVPLWEIDWWPGPVVKSHYGFKSAQEAYMFGTSEVFEGQEGVVLTWLRPNQPSYRLKIKTAEYIQLHKFFTGVSVKGIWEALSQGEFDNLIERAPDEMFEWIKSVQQGLLDQYNTIEKQCLAEFARTPTGSRREIAEYYKSCAYPSILFSLLDRKPYSPLIWRMVKPTGHETYKVDIDT